MLARMSILGNAVVRREDPAFLTVGGTYVDDLQLDGAARVVYVRSTIAHARITELDVSEARGAPGVLAVVTADELGLADLPVGGPRAPAVVRPVLARDVVRFVGEPIVAVVAESLASALDAAELVVVDYDPLPPVVDPVEAMADEVLLFEGSDSNVAARFENRAGDLDFSGCEVVIEADFVNQRVAACPLEGRAAAADWQDGRLVHWFSGQGAHPVRDEMAQIYGLEHDQVRVITPDVGGGFGAKAPTYPETIALGALARIVGRPVIWAESRTENMTAMSHGRAQVQHVRMGGTRDGRITHYDLQVIQDCGAYPLMGAVLPWMTRTMVTGVYDIAHATFDSASVLTTTTPVGAYRGAGRPEATAAVERAVDLFAAEVGLDPAEVRRRNLVAADAFPYTTAIGTEYDTGDYVGALDRVLEASGYDELRAEQARRRAADDPTLLGIGVSVYVEITAYGGGGEHGSCELRRDGTVLVLTGSSPYGQGHHTAWSMLVSERLGIPMDRVEVRHGDTDLVPSGSITGGSRSVQIAGASVWEAAGDLVDQARARAADLLEASADDIVHDAARGVFHTAGVPARTVDWAAIAATLDGTPAAPEASAAEPVPLVGSSGFTADGPTFPFGAHVAVVEVDRDTGQVRLVRMVAVDDAGTILNPLLATGQVHGGLAQGAAQALFEEVRFDEEGNPLTTTFADYAVISATELPPFERIAMETPTFRNPLGAKGIGESGTIGATPAVQSAVIDALAPFGVRHVDMPLTPEKVWRALR
jgi:aerobic carbon-monoxide dehydrogenase large subunit